jgi:hypothetical protein
LIKHWKLIATAPTFFAADRTAHPMAGCKEGKEEAEERG